MSTFLKALFAALAAFAIGVAGFLYLEAARHIVLLICAAIFATLAYYVAIFRGRLRDAALIGASLSLGLVIIEGALLLVGSGPTTYRDKGAYAVIGELGVGPARAGAIHEKKVGPKGEVVYDVVYTIDEHLRRKVVSAETGPTIAFFGDSFPFGAGLNDEDTLPQIFADATGRKFHVLNLAVGGWGPQQFLRVLENGVHDALLKSDPRIFIMPSAPWHAHRTSCKASYVWFGPAYELQNGEPVYRGSCASQAPPLTRALTMIFRWTEAFNYFSREEPVIDADIDLYVAILTKAGRIAREKYGVPTAILYLGDDLSRPLYRLRPGVTNEAIAKRLREGGLKVVDGVIDWAAYPGQALAIAGDGHPTGLANRIWAERVRDFVSAELAAAR